MIKSDRWIRRMALEHGMIFPFEPEQVKVIVHHRSSTHVVSYGTSSYGYDMRIDEKFKVFTPVHCEVVDPKDLPEKALEDVTEQVRKQGYCLIPPNSFALGVSVERFQIPRDVLMIVLGKSTYARCGIIVSCTPAEPEWCGHLTLEISNTTPLPAKVYANEGIAQCVFFGADEECETSYADRKGKYMNQPREVVPPR